MAESNRAESRRPSRAERSTILKRAWEIVGLWPKITDPELERRVERFIMHATGDELFEMQEVVFAEATPYLVEDDKVRTAMRAFDGRSIGLAIDGWYKTTVSLIGLRFSVSRGISDGVPVFTVKCRRDYADAVLSHKDPLSLFLKGHIRITHMLTLVKWLLPHLPTLMDRRLFDKFLGYQPDVEEELDKHLAGLGY